MGFDTDIKNFYVRKHKIEIMDRTIKILNEQYKKIAADIDNSNIKLNSDIGSTNYEKLGGSTSEPMQSQQEKSLEKAFKELENRLEYIKVQITIAELDKSNLELENIKMEVFLKELEIEEISVIQLKYEQNRTYQNIGLILNMSVSTAHTITAKVISKYCNFYQQKTVEKSPIEQNPNETWIKPE